MTFEDIEIMGESVEDIEQLEWVDKSVCVSQNWGIGIYSGMTKNCAPHGVGRWICEKGIIDEGQFKEGRCSGFVKEYSNEFYRNSKMLAGKCVEGQEYNINNVMTKEFVNGKWVDV